MKNFRAKSSLVTAVLLAMLQMAFSGQVFAIGAFKPTVEELKLLPPYCKPKAINANEVENYNQLPEVKKWRRILGPDYDHLHHYCIALQYLNRSYRVHDPIKKEFLYKVAINNIEYVQRHSSRNFKLNPEILLKKGQILLLMNNYAGAIMAFQKSIEYKRDYSPPYAELYRVYRKLGMEEQAREILDKGLKYNPKSKKLRRLLQEGA